jgi:hypothetical protein
MMENNFEELNSDDGGENQIEDKESIEMSDLGNTTPFKDND